MRKTKTITIFICSLCMILSACSASDNETIKESYGTHAIVETSETLVSEETLTTYYMLDQYLLANVSEYYELSDEIEIKNEFSDITKIIHDVHITKTFEEEITEWSVISTGIEDIETQNKTITNDFSIVYISGTVTNNADKEESYGLSSVRVMQEQDGALWGIGKELGYSNLMGNGKSAQILTLRPEESKDFRLGYLVPDEYLEYPLYLEVTGISGSENYKVIPFGEK